MKRFKVSGTSIDVVLKECEDECPAFIGDCCEHSFQCSMFGSAKESYEKPFPSFCGLPEVNNED